MGGASLPRTKLRVDPRKFAGQVAGTGTCTQQLSALLTCLQRENFEESSGQCKAQYEALAECARSARAAASARKGHVPTINYHLARMSKLMRR
jgi:hypothetical protein